MRLRFTGYSQNPSIKLSFLKNNTEKENEYNLIDLFINAKRQLIRSNYTDTLARFWRIYEGVLFYHFRKRYGVEPGDLWGSKNQERVKDILNYLYPDTKKLSIANSVKILKEVFKDKTFIKLVGQAILAKRGQSHQKLRTVELLEELRSKRNESIAAHGMKPVMEDDAVNCIRVAEVLIKEFLPDASMMIDNYPLNFEQVQRVTEVLDNAFAL